MKRFATRNKAIVIVAVLTGYIASYLALWKPGMDVVYCYTFDRGCITKTREVPELRSRWIARGALRAPVTAMYWPINAVLLSQSKWK